MVKKAKLLVGILVLVLALASWETANFAETYYCYVPGTITWNAGTRVMGICYYGLNIEGEVKECNHEECGQCTAASCLTTSLGCRYVRFATPIE